MCGWGGDQGGGVWSRSCLNRLLVLFTYRFWLIIPCEVASKSVIPALRALVARELIEEYGLKQEQVATKLGGTQAAVSKYQHQVRGEAVEIRSAPQIRDMDKKISSIVFHNPKPLP